MSRLGSLGIELRTPRERNRVRRALGPDIVEPLKVGRRRRSEEFRRSEREGDGGGLDLLLALLGTIGGGPAAATVGFFGGRTIQGISRRKKAQKFDVFLQKKQFDAQAVAREALREGILSPDEARSLFGQIQVSNILPPDVTTIKQLVGGGLDRFQNEGVR